MNKWRILGVFIFLIGCVPQESQNSISQVLAPTNSPTETIAILVRATPTEITEKEGPEPNFIDTDCLQNMGEIQIFDLNSSFLDQGLQFRVFLPPCYKEQDTRKFPVLYLIHGQTYNDDQWDRLGADESAQELISSAEAAPFLIVMPFDLGNAQPAIDPFNQAFIEELIPYIDQNFRTIDKREYRAVGGLSRGASWALHFALQYPELFSAVGGHSPPIFVEDAPKVRNWLKSIPSDLMPRIWLDIGEKDQLAIMNSALWFEDLLTENNIAHQWYLFPGNHDEAYWRSHVELYLRWYTENW